MDFKAYAQSKQTVICLELERVSKLLDMAGRPDEKLKIIHVAGTNGKGSVCAVIGCGLMKMGRRVGRFSSPELFSVTDIVKVNEIDISSKELFDIYDVLSPFCEQIEKETGVAPSQFEINFVAALIHFVNSGCDYAILECGMGGIGDATNAISDSVISIITKISLDHTSFLGDTVEKIAANKCGIFKESSAVITGFQTSGVLSIIKEKAGLRELVEAEAPECVGFENFNEIFNYGSCKNLKCSLCGVHQTQNAALAIEALRLLGADEEVIRYAVSNAKNPARFERLADGVYFDGGHNPDGVKSLVDSINRYGIKGKMIFAAGMMADKDISGAFECLKELDNQNFEIYACRVHSNPRSASAEDIAAVARQKGFEAKVFDCINDACTASEGRCDILIIFGSLYMYRECTRYCEVDVL